MKTIKEITQEELEQLYKDKELADKLVKDMDNALRTVNTKYLEQAKEKKNLLKRIDMLIEIKHCNEETIRSLKEQITLLKALSNATDTQTDKPADNPPVILFNKEDNPD